ncbi:MAG: hypothetical protein ACRYGP_23335 [Janthinobacterium lividum]
MILDILVFVLGFLVAGLLALAVLPAVWRRALRLSEERLSRLVPLSPEEVSAERDHLRAIHAVELRRVELRAERAVADRTTLQFEAARREQRILALDAEGARAQVAMAVLEAEIGRLQSELAGLWAECGAEAVALHGLSQLAERRLSDIAVLQADRNALESERDRLVEEVDRNRSRVAGLETRLVGAETHNEDLTRDLAEARRSALAAAERDTAAQARHLADHHAEVESLKTELAFMSEQAASAERRATEAIKARDAMNKASQDIVTTKRPLSSPAGLDETTRLRAAVSALAEDILGAGQTV